MLKYIKSIQTNFRKRCVKTNCNSKACNQKCKCKWIVFPYQHAGFLFFFSSFSFLNQLKYMHSNI